MRGIKVVGSIRSAAAADMELQAASLLLRNVHNLLHTLRQLSSLLSPIQLLLLLLLLLCCLRFDTTLVRLVALPEGITLPATPSPQRWHM